MYSSDVGGTRRSRLDNQRMAELSRTSIRERHKEYNEITKKINDIDKEISRTMAILGKSNTTNTVENKEGLVSAFSNIGSAFEKAGIEIGSAFEKAGVEIGQGLTMRSQQFSFKLLDDQVDSVTKMLELNIHLLERQLDIEYKLVPELLMLIKETKERKNELKNELRKQEHWQDLRREFSLD